MATRPTPRSGHTVWIHRRAPRQHRGAAELPLGAAAFKRGGGAAADAQRCHGRNRCGATGAGVCRLVGAP
eukprot:72056-Chlamydomonas_euryale.AAC.1